MFFFIPHPSPIHVAEMLHSSWAQNTKSQRGFAPLLHSDMVNKGDSRPSLLNEQLKVIFWLAKQDHWSLSLTRALATLSQMGLSSINKVLVESIARRDMPIATHRLPSCENIQANMACCFGLFGILLARLICGFEYPASQQLGNGLLRSVTYFNFRIDCNSGLNRSHWTNLSELGWYVITYYHYYCI